jgi:hypothetical protein
MLWSKRLYHQLGGDAALALEVYAKQARNTEAETKAMSSNVTGQAMDPQRPTDAATRKPRHSALGVGPGGGPL